MNKAKLITLGLWLGIVLLASYQVFVNTVVRSDMSVFIPKVDDVRVGLLTSSAVDSPAARLWLLALQGGSAEQLAQVSQSLSRQLRESGRFNSVFNGANLLAQEDESFLFNYRYLLDPQQTSQSYTVESLRRELKQRLTELASPLSVFSKKWLAADPTAVFSRVIQQMAIQTDSPEYFNNVWMTKEHDQAFIVAETKAAGMELDEQSAIKDYLNDSLAQINGSENIQLRFSGSPNIGIQSRDQIKSESQRLSSIASIFMLVFLLWIYRSPKRVLMTVLPLGLAILVATAVVSYLFDGIHGITLAFGITVLGVAVDYPIHVVSHANNQETFSTTIGKIWPTLRLGVISTILGYSAMAVTDFPGLSQFGVFSIVGLLTAAYATRSLFSSLNFSSVETPRLFYATNKLNFQPSKPIFAIVALLLLVSVATLLKVDEYWSQDLSELSPIPKHVLEQDHKLRQMLGQDQPRYLLSVQAEDLETMLIREEKLMSVLQQAIQQDELQALQMAAQILPSQQQQNLRKSHLPDEATISRNLSKALQGLPFKRERFLPFIKDIAKARNMDNLNYRQLQASHFGSLLTGLVGQDSKGFSGIVRLSGIHKPDKLTQRLEQANIPGVFFMDIKQSSNNLLSQFRQEAIDRIFWAIGLLLLILGVGLRNLNRLIRVIIPVVCAVVVASAVPLGLGEKLNIFHVVSFLLVAGISLDYGLFFSWCSNAKHSTQTLHALSICALSTIAVFSLLATASIPVLHTIGLTVASGVTAAFIFSWTFSRTFSSQEYGRET